MSDINATLEALITKAPEGYPEDYAEWACPYCEKPVTVDGADDMLLHVASEHENKKEHKMRNFCTSHGINYADVMARLGDPHIVVEKKAEKPAPAPAPQPVVDAPKPEPKSSVKPCACGFVGKDGKEAGVHKRSCVIWKTENGKAPKQSSGMSDTQLWDVLEQAISALSGVSKERDADVAVYEDFEAQKAKLQKWEEVKPTLQPLVALGYGAREYEVADNAFKELKVRLETKIAFSDAYARGQKAQQLVLEERIQERSKLVKECSDLNAALEEKAEARIAAWVAAETARFEQLLDGRMRVQGSNEVLTFVYNTNWSVSTEVSKLASAKSFTLADEPYICDEKARLALEAVGFLAEKSFPVKGIRKDVSDDGKIIETKSDSEVTATLPLGQWANRLVKILLYVRKVFRASDKKIKADEAMTTDEFKGLFGFVLQEADPSLDIARWRVAGRKAESKPKVSKAEEGINAFGAAMQKANLTVDDILAAKPNGETNQRQSKKGGKKGKRH